MVQVIIPISHDPRFFPAEDYYFPKPLVEVSGNPLVVEVLSNLNSALNALKFIFVVPHELDVKYSLGNILQMNCMTDSCIIHRKGSTSGGLCSTLLAIDQLIDEEPILILNMDEILDINIESVLNGFDDQEADAGIVTFRSSHPRWCYAKLSNDNSVISCSEKRVISNNVFVGFYYFKNKLTFVNAATKAMINDASLDGSFYISSCKSINFEWEESYKSYDCSFRVLFFVQSES